MANTDKVFDDVEMLEGGSPADVGLDATRSDDELTLSEREELEALRAFKSYFDDCMVGQGYEIANFHMNGELEPFDNFYASAMEEHNKAIEKSGKEQSEINFSNCVDLTADIYFSEARGAIPAEVDLSIIPSSFEAEETLIERTDICERIGFSAFGIHDAQMAGEDIRVNFYGIYDEKQNISLEVIVDAGDSFYESATVPLSDSEKESLKNAMETACQSLTKHSLEEFITKGNEENQEEKITDIDFHNAVDSTAEIMTDDGKVNAMLYLTDAQYEAIVGRTDCESDLGASFAEILHDDGTTMNVYVDVYPDLNAVMTLAVESDTYGWKDYNVPLTADEARILINDMEKAAGERYGLTLDEMIVEATVSSAPKIENAVTESASQSRVVAEFITSEDEECAILQNADGTFQNHYENGILHEVGFQTYAGAYDMLRCRKDEDVMMVFEQPEITQYSEHIIDIKPAESLKIDYDLGMIISAETKEPLPPYTTTLVAGVDNGALLIREDEIPAATSYLKEIGIAVPTTNTVEVNGREETVWAFNPEKLAEINPSGTREYEKAAEITPEMRQQAVQSYKYWAGGEREEKQKERLPEPKKTKSSDERDDR